MAIIKYLRFFIEIFDIFAIRPADIYTFKKSFYYSNIYTKISTTIVGILAISYFGYLFNDTISHDKPDPNYYETYSHNPELINFGENDYFIAFGIEDANGNLIADQTLFQLEMFILNKSIILNQIELDNCSNIQNRSKSLEMFLNKIENSSNYFCLKNYMDFKLAGSWDSQDFLNIQLSFLPCVNTTENNENCKSLTEMKDFISQSSFIMKYSTYRVEPFDYENPIQEIMGDYFQPLNPDDYTKMYLYFAGLTVYNRPISLFSPISDKVDKGIIIKNEKFSTKNREESDKFFSINMRLDSSEKYFYRTYKIWTDVLSSVGGFFCCLKLILNLILMRYLRIALMQRVSNEIFDYEKILEQSEKKEAPEKTLQDRDKTPMKIKISFWVYLKSIFCFCCYKEKLSKKEKIFKQALRQMKTDYDISNLMNRIIDAEKIQFVLSENDYKKLRKITKPKLRMNTNLTESSGNINNRDRKLNKTFYFQNDNMMNSLRNDKIKKNLEENEKLTAEIFFEKSERSISKVIKPFEKEIELSQIIPIQRLDFQNTSCEIHHNNLKLSKFKNKPHRTISFADKKFYDEGSDKIYIHKNNLENIDDIESKEENLQENPALDDFVIADEDLEDDASNRALGVFKKSKEINELRPEPSYLYYFEKPKN